MDKKDGEILEKKKQKEREIASEAIELVQLEYLPIRVD